MPSSPTRSAGRRGPRRSPASTRTTTPRGPWRRTRLTGQSAHNRGVRGDNPPHGGAGARDARETLPVWLQRAGYYTAHVGKYLNGYGQVIPATVPPGWSRWLGLVDPTTYEFYDYTLSDDGHLVQRR